MKAIKKIKRYFHTRESFKKVGLKQTSTWIGIIIFICVFHEDFFSLIHNILDNASLTEKLSAGLASLAITWFNKIEKK